MTRLKTALCAALLCALSACVHTPPIPDFAAAVTSPSLSGTGPASTTVPFQLDDNRIFVEVRFVKPDGSERKALAFVNMGAGALTLTNALFRELAPVPGKPLHMKFGTMDIATDGAAVQPEGLANNMTISFSAAEPSAAESARDPGGLMAQFADPLPVEAILPPGLLQHFQVAYDYAARTMTLAAPGTLKPEGIAVPIRVNPKTGFAMVDARIDGGVRTFAIDNGGSYGAIRSAEPFVVRHPDWLRSIGGIGEANYLMNGAETDTPVVKLRGVALGPLHLDEVGVVQIGGGGLLMDFVSGLFWDRIYSAKAGEPVQGWIAGNTLKSFRFTVDYPNRMSYWLQQAPLDTRDLDQVGITLMHVKGVTTIAGVAQKDGKPALTGVEPGDVVTKIGEMPTAGATRGALLAALHGTPGEIKHLTLERDGKSFDVDAPVMAF